MGKSRSKMAWMALGRLGRVPLLGVGALRDEAGDQVLDDLMAEVA